MLAESSSAEDLQRSLETLFSSTSGPNWNFTALNAALPDYGSECEDYVGIPWNFTQVNNSYVHTGPCDEAGGTWAGIKCSCNASNFCDITGIALPEANLKGQLVIPMSLTSVTRLLFARNALSGTIPKTVGHFKNLISLRMHENQITGRISPQAMQNLTLLEEIDLNNNKLTGPIPWEQLVNCTQLESIELYRNKLTGSLPANIAKLTRLSKLDLEHNILSGSLPDGLGWGCMYLEYLFLSNTSLSGTIPESLTHLQHLKELFMAQNNFNGQIPSFGETHVGALGALGMPYLVYLMLPNNTLSGSIPKSFGKLYSLHHLDISNNNLEGYVPDNLNALSRLQSLRLSHNDFVSQGGAKSTAEKCSTSLMPFVNSYSQTNLTVIDLSYNSFSGLIDTNIFRPPRLEVFNAEANCFCGEIPDSICQATKLETLVISGLGGGISCRSFYWEGTAFYPVPFDGFSSSNTMAYSELPSCVWTLPKLETLHASGNKLLGTIPNDIGPNIRHVDLGHNHLSGTISFALAKATSLRSLNLVNNNIGGNLTVFAANATDTENNNIRDLDLQLALNRLSGPLPSSLQTLRSVNILSGNIFGCKSNDELPQQDASASTYSCGSDYFSFCVAEFLSFLTILSFVFAFIYVIKLYSQGAVGDRCRLYWNEIFIWFKASDGTSGVLIAEIKDHVDLRVSLRSVARYSRGLARLRVFTILGGGSILVVYLFVYLSLTGIHRKIEYNYLWSTTAAYLTGLTSTIVCVVFFTASLLGMRHLINNDVMRSKNRFHFMEGREVNKKKSDAAHLTCVEVEALKAAKLPWYKRVMIPSIRLIVISLINFGMIVLANALYLYVHFSDFSNEIQSSSAVIFAFFKLIWTGNVVPALFGSSWLYMGVPDRVHAVFIRRVIGDEITLKFLFSVFIWVLIPLVSIAIQSKSCFYGLFIAQPAQVFKYTVSQCVHHNNENVCDKRGLIPYWSFLTNPFVYNYQCAGSIMAAYIPIHIQTSVIMFIKSGLRIYGLLHKVGISSSTTLLLPPPAYCEKDEAYSHVAPVSPTASPDVSPNSSDLDVGELKRMNAAVAVDVNAHAGGSSSNSTTTEVIVAKEIPESWFDASKRYGWYLSAGLTIFFYFKSDIQIFNGNVKNTVKTFVAAIFAGAFSPTRLMWSFDERKAFHETRETKDACITSGAVGATGNLASYLSSILIIFTFGLLSPLMAMIMSISVILDTLVLQLTLGKFLSRECTVVLVEENFRQLVRRRKEVVHNRESEPEVSIDDDRGQSLKIQPPFDEEAYKEKLLLKPEVLLHNVFFRPNAMTTSQVHKGNVTKLLRGFLEPYGALAALEPVVEECATLPVSLLNLGRKLYMVIISAFLGFIINDMYNSEALILGGVAVQSILPALFMATFLPAFELCVFVSKIRKVRSSREAENDAKEESDVEMSTTAVASVENPITKGPAKT